MTGSRWRWVAALSLVLFAFWAWAGERACRAGTKEDCLDAHGRGQDLRDAGRLTSARQTFFACAQSSCPALIQADCARFGEELDRLVPSVSFAARDPAGADLPDTAVLVDDQPVASRLDDGRPYDLDPGKHVVRFVHAGREVEVTVVIDQGEKGRGVVATFPVPEALSAARGATTPPPPAPRKPILPLVVAGAGAIAAVTGAVIAAVGLSEVPSSCSIGSRQCEATPGDPAFGRAHDAVSLANVGLGVGLGGAAVLACGALWYAASPARPPREQVSVVPWAGDRAGGVGVRGAF